MKTNFKLVLLSFLLYSCSPQPEEVKQAELPIQDQPNVVLIITDDQGYGDLGFHGNPHIKTPTLDALAKRSVRFKNFFVSPVCAPTRSSIMTGRHSLRTGIHDTYNGGAIMAANEVTIAEILSEAGYSTGLFGKWHLGDNYPSRPHDQGFQETLHHLGVILIRHFGRKMKRLRLKVIVLMYLPMQQLTLFGTTNTSLSLLTWLSMHHMTHFNCQTNTMKCTKTLIQLLVSKMMTVHFQRWMSEIRK
jgi:hypothetical protein